MKVSIITSVYNQEKYVLETINSVLSQTYKNIEYIVIDDGSTDKTNELLSSIRDDRFKLITQENKGQSHSLNLGWKIATGNLISYLSADDLYDSELVAKTVEIFRKSKNIIITYPNFEFINENSKKIGQSINLKFSKKKLFENLDCQIGPGVFFRKELFQKIGGWDINLKQAPDLDYWIRSSEHGIITNINEILASYRVHRESTSYRKISIERSEEMLYIINKNKNLFENYNYNNSISNAYFITSINHLKSNRYRYFILFFYKAVIKSNVKILFKILTYKKITFNLIYGLRIFKK